MEEEGPHEMEVAQKEKEKDEEETEEEGRRAVRSAPRFPLFYFLIISPMG